ncbi:MAG TPA: sialate O-acetylesterase, partial [bacterium]|nr:sialate O-acetylesterase [bacterium]
AAAFAEGHSYVMFTNLAVAGDGTLRGEWKTTTAGGSLHNRAPFNALQIVGLPTSPVITEPPPPPLKLSLLHRKLYVVLLGGQSNAVGWGYRQYLLASGDPLAESQPDVLFYFYALSNPYFPNTLTNLQCGSGQFRYDAPTSGKVLQYPELTNAPILRFGPELSLGRVIRDRIKIPNSKVAVIKYAVQGSSLYQDWLPDGTTNSATDGALYQKFQSVVWSGLAALQNQYPDYEIEILGMGWVQGEADATVLSAANNYSNNLARLVADVRATFNTNMVFALSKLSPNQAIGAYYSTVQAAQQAVAGAVPRVVATDTTGANYPVATGFTEGSIHFLSTSLLQIGRDLGNAIVTTSGLDMDEDGLPDAWENSFAPGAAGLGNSPSADYDGDGLTDIQEYEIGTSPVDPNDRLAFSLGSDLIGRWSAKQDIRYQAMASTNLISWVEFGNPVLLRSSNSPVEVDFSPFIATNKSGFFRIEVR